MNLWLAYIKGHDENWATIPKLFIKKKNDEPNLKHVTVIVSWKTMNLPLLDDTIPDIISAFRVAMLCDT